MDGDVFEVVPFLVQLSNYVAQCHISAAFSIPIVPPITLGLGRMRKLKVDFEGCHFIGDHWQRFVALLGVHLNGQLESLAVSILGSNLVRSDLVLPFGQIARAMHLTHAPFFGFEESCTLKRISNWLSPPSMNGMMHWMTSFAVSR